MPDVNVVGTLPGLYPPWQSLPIHPWCWWSLVGQCPLVHFLGRTFILQPPSYLVQIHGHNGPTLESTMETGENVQIGACDVGAVLLHITVHPPGPLCKFILDVDGLRLDDAPRKLLLHPLQRPVVAADLQCFPLCFECFHGVWRSHHGRPWHLVLHRPCLICRWKGQCDSTY